jgi:hypothetical protein
MKLIVQHLWHTGLAAVDWKTFCFGLLAQGKNFTSAECHDGDVVNPKSQPAHEKCLHLDGFDFDNDLGTPRLQKALMGACREVRLLAQPIRRHQRILSNAAALEVMHGRHPKRPPQPSAAIVATMPVPPV